MSRQSQMLRINTHKYVSKATESCIKTAAIVGKILLAITERNVYFYKSH